MKEMPSLVSPLGPNYRVAFYGPMCSGKTFAADYLVNHYGYRKVNFAGKLKELARNIFDVQGKDGHDRTVLQQLGQKMREIDPDIWIKLALEQIRYNHPDSRVVIDDLRYANEAVALRNSGFKIIRVYTSDDIRNERIKKLYPDTPIDANQHSSEQDWVNIEPDYVVNGNHFNQYEEDILKVLKLQELVYDAR